MSDPPAPPASIRRTRSECSVPLSTMPTAMITTPQTIAFPSIAPATLLIGSPFEAFQDLTASGTFDGGGHRRKRARSPIPDRVNAVVGDFPPAEHPTGQLVPSSLGQDHLPQSVVDATPGVKEIDSGFHSPVSLRWLVAVSLKPYPYWIASTGQTFRQRAQLKQSAGKRLP